MVAKANTATSVSETCCFKTSHSLCKEVSILTAHDSNVALKEASRAVASDLGGLPMAEGQGSAKSAWWSGRGESSDLHARARRSDQESDKSSASTSLA